MILLNRLPGKNLKDNGVLIGNQVFMGPEKFAEIASQSVPDNRGSDSLSNHKGHSGCLAWQDNQLAYLATNPTSVGKEILKTALIGNDE